MFTQQPNSEYEPVEDRRSSPIVSTSHIASHATSSSGTQPIKKGPTVELVEGNLLDQKVDSIVNAWNRNLIPYWLLVTQGVSGAIKRAGGIQPFRELRKFGTLPLGAARLTSAGTLPFQGIIHVAGINHAWRSSEYSIRESVKNALIIANNENFSSLAFPAIGAGSSIRIGQQEISIWGISQKRSLEIIQKEAMRSEFQGKIIIVKFKKSGITTKSSGH